MNSRVPTHLLLVAAAALLPAVLVCAETESSSGAQRVAPSKGDVIPAFETLTIDGQPRKVSFPVGSRTVLLFFLSGCPVCHKMIPEWNRAYDRRPKGLEVLGVIMDQEPPGFWSTLSVRFPVLRSPGRDFLRSIDVHRAPLTLRVGEGGKVEEAALGIVDPIRLGEILRP